MSNTAFMFLCPSSQKQVIKKNELPTTLISVMKSVSTKLLSTKSKEETHLVFWNVSRTLKLFLSNEKQEIISICGSVSLEEEVTHKEVGPVRGSLHHDEPCVCQKNSHLLELSSTNVFMDHKAYLTWYVHVSA